MARELGGSISSVYLCSARVGGSSGVHCGNRSQP
jgi:hypothetical protein